MGNTCQGQPVAQPAELVAAEPEWKVKIHGLPISSNALGPILLAMDVGCGGMETCDIPSGATQTPEFLGMNPFHTIPTMESMDSSKFCLGESQSIMRYIARKYKPELYPSDPKLAARCDWALDALGTTVLSAFMNIVYPVAGFLPFPEDKQAAADKMKDAMNMFCATFMDGSKTFICGDTISIADYKALPFIYALSHPVVELKTGVTLAPRLKAYLEQLVSSIIASSIITDPDPSSKSLKVYLDSRRPEGADFNGPSVMCGQGGQGVCAAMSTGPVVKDEKEAKIWGLPISANASSPAILAKDVGIGSLEVCDLMKDEHLRPEYLAKNPFHQIPTFEASDGFCLGESNAAIRFIAVNYKKELYAESIEDQGRIDWAMDTIATGIYKKMAYGVFYGVFGFHEPPADQEEANKECTTILEEFEKAFLQDKKFVMGDKVTIVEYKFVPFLFCIAQPAVEKKTKFKLSERMQTYLNDILDAIPVAAEYLTTGPMNIKDFCQQIVMKDWKVKVHGLPISANALGPILLVEDVGCGGMQACDIMNGASRTPEFLEMNAFHTIPTMQSLENQCCLGESQSIMRYVARKYKPELYPSDAKLAARVDWALDALGTTVYTAWADIVYPVLGFAGQPADQAKAIEKMKEVLDMFCAAFIHKDRKYICGDTITIADYKALPFFFCLNHSVIELKSGVSLSPRLKEYVAELLKSIPMSSLLTDPSGTSLHTFLESKRLEGPDFSGTTTVCGSGSCGDVKTGAPQANEKKAKVWGMPFSANASSVAILVKVAGVGALQKCDLMKGEHLKPDFLAKNPFHQIPTFEGSDGFCLGESNAALRYIASNYRKELYPDNVEDRGKIDWAMDAIATGIYKKMAYGVFYGVFGFASPPVNQDEANQACTTILEEFEKAFLQDKKFVMGDKVSLAEYKFVPFLFCISQPTVEKRTKFKLSTRMQRYLQDILTAVPAAKDFLTKGTGNIKDFAASKK